MGERRDRTLAEVRAAIVGEVQGTIPLSMDPFREARFDRAAEEALAIAERYYATDLSRRAEELDRDKMLLEGQRNEAVSALDPFVTIANVLDAAPHGGPPSPLLAVREECDHARDVVRRIAG